MSRPETETTVQALAMRTGADSAILWAAIEAALAMLGACMGPEAVQAYLRADGLSWLPASMRAGAVARRKRRFVGDVANALPADVVLARRQEIAEAAYAEVTTMTPARLGTVMRENRR